MSDIFFEDNKHDIFSTFLDWVAENKAVPMVWGAGFSLGSSDKKIDTFLREFENKNSLKEFFYKYESSLSKYGAGVLFFDKNNVLRMANPIYPIYCETNGEIVTSISFIETSRGFNGKLLYKAVNLQAKGTTISSSLTPLINYGLTGAIMQKEIPTEMKPSEVESFERSNQLNGVWTLNIERYNPLLFNMNFRTPDCRNLKKDFFENLQYSYDAIIDDIFVSRNKLIIYDDETKNGINDPANQNAFLNKVKEATKSMVVRTQRKAVLGGKEANTEFFKGTPNALTLWANFWNYWEIGLAESGYSSFRDSSNYATATANRMSKDLDLITSDYKKRLRETQIRKMFDKLLIANKLWDGKDRRPYYFVINDLYANDKETGLQRVKMLEDFGFITHTDAMMMLFPNLTREEAEEKIKSIIEEKNKYPEVTQNENIENGETSAGEDKNYAGNQAKKLSKPEKKTQEKQQKNNEGE